MMNFSERRDSILSVFSKAKSDLENLNKEIQSETIANSDRISSLEQRNRELGKIRIENESIIKTFSKLFKQ